jgi:hypothetical protein
MPGSQVTTRCWEIEARPRASWILSAAVTLVGTLGLASSPRHISLQIGALLFGALVVGFLVMTWWKSSRPPLGLFVVGGLLGGLVVFAEHRFMSFEEDILDLERCLSDSHKAFACQSGTSFAIHTPVFDYVLPVAGPVLGVLAFWLLRREHAIRTGGACDVLGETARVASLWLAGAALVTSLLASPDVALLEGSFAIALFAVWLFDALRRHALLRDVERGARDGWACEPGSARGLQPFVSGIAGSQRLLTVVPTPGSPFRAATLRAVVASAPRSDLAARVTRTRAAVAALAMLVMLVSIVALALRPEA